MDELGIQIFESNYTDLTDYTEGTIDPKGPDSGTLRLIRSGGWSSTALNCHSAHRAEYGPGGSTNNHGFRPARGSVP